MSALVTAPDRRRRRPTSTTSANASAARAGRSGRPSTTGRRASRWRTCRSCARHWADGYDWRRVEAELNRFEQLRFVPDVGAPDTRRHPGAARPVAAPRRAAARADPRLAGLGRRVPRRRRAAARPDRQRRRPGRRLPRRLPDDARLRLQRQADARRAGTSSASPIAWTELMTALGYDRFGAQGGDWGSAITTALGASHGDRVRRHPPQHGVGRARARTATTSPRPSRRRWPGWRSTASGAWATRRSSRPGRRRSATASSTRRPAQAAWIVEKFWAWADHEGHPEDAVSRDRLLDNVMHYWLPAAGASSARLYWESFNVFGRRRHDRRAVGHVDLPEGDLRPVAPLGRAPLHRHPPLERARRRRPLRRVRAARRCSSTRCGRSSAPCADGPDRSARSAPRRRSGRSRRTTRRACGAAWSPARRGTPSTIVATSAWCGGSRSSGAASRLGAREERRQHATEAAAVGGEQDAPAERVDRRAAGHRHPPDVAVHQGDAAQVGGDGQHRRRRRRARRAAGWRRARRAAAAMSSTTLNGVMPSAERAT